MNTTRSALKHLRRGREDEANHDETETAPEISRSISFVRVFVHITVLFIVVLNNVNLPALRQYLTEGTQPKSPRMMTTMLQGKNDSLSLRGAGLSKEVNHTGKIEATTREETEQQRINEIKKASANKTLQESIAEMKQERQQSPQLQQQKQQQKQVLIQDSVAACVMIMDGNHELIEWLAYHYHTVSLRRLIFLNDPYSLTTPAPITRRWEGLMNVTIWSDHDVFPNGGPKRKNAADTYVARQVTFHKHCINTLQGEGYKWIGIFDPDEYMHVNEKVFDPNDKMYNLGLKENHAKHAITVGSSLEEPGVMLQFIKNVISHVQRYGTQNNPFLTYFETPCIPFRRRDYGAFEHISTSDSDNATLPLDNNDVTAQDLSTFRWKYWGHPSKNIIGKSLLDMERVFARDVVSGNPHLPLGDIEICRPDLVWRLDSQVPLVMNHYSSGTLEQMLFRSGDSRGGIEGRVKRFEQSKELKRYHDTNSTMMKSWLPGFVELMGKKEATRLLKDAGKPYHANIGAYLDPSKEKSEEEWAKVVETALQINGTAVLVNDKAHQINGTSNQR